MVAKNDLSNFLETALPEWQKGDVETWSFNFFSGWCFQISFIFTPKIGEYEPNLTFYFSNGWVETTN